MKSRNVRFFSSSVPVMTYSAACDSCRAENDVSLHTVVRGLQTKYTPPEQVQICDWSHSGTQHTHTHTHTHTRTNMLHSLCDAGTCELLYHHLVVFSKHTPECCINNFFYFFYCIILPILWQKLSHKLIFKLKY